MKPKSKMIWLGPEGFLPGIGMGRPGKSIMIPAEEAEAYQRQKQARPYTADDKRREEALARASKLKIREAPEKAAKEEAQPRPAEKTTGKPTEKEDEK